MTEFAGKLKDPGRTRGGHSNPTAAAFDLGVPIFGRASGYELL